MSGMASHIYTTLLLAGLSLNSLICVGTVWIRVEFDVFGVSIKDELLLVQNAVHEDYRI